MPLEQSAITRMLDSPRRGTAQRKAALNANRPRYCSDPKKSDRGALMFGDVVDAFMKQARFRRPSARNRGRNTSAS